MSNIIGEGKKISELPAALGFSDDAIVLIVDKGRTAQMSLKLLTQTIAEATVGKDGALVKKVGDNTLAIEELGKNLKDVSKKQTDFQEEVSDDASKQNGRIAANENNINDIMYHTTEITVADAVTNRQYKTSDVSVNTAFDPESSLIAAETGAFALSREIKAGDVIYIGDLYDMVETSDAPNIILVNEGKVISMVLMATAKSQGYFSFGDLEGTMYLSAMMAESADTVLFEHKALIDFTDLVNRVTALEGANASLKDTVTSLQSDYDEIMETLKNNGLA